jgi:TATA-binding protein-associated factor Taf7
MRMFLKIIGIIFLFLFIKSIIHDLSVGTATEISTPNNEQKQEKEEMNQDVKDQTNTDTQEDENHPFKTVSYKVKAGETVLSIAEELNELTISIQQLIEDFEQLNPSTNPHQIRIDETYLFPVYPTE